jgi:hypothetical protein
VSTVGSRDPATGGCSQPTAGWTVAFESAKFADLDESGRDADADSVAHGLHHLLAELLVGARYAAIDSSSIASWTASGDCWATHQGAMLLEEDYLRVTRRAGRVFETYFCC